MKKLDFSAKVIFIIILIILGVIILSYDDDSNDADKFRLGFPIDQSEIDANNKNFQSKQSQDMKAITKIYSKKTDSQFG